MDLEGNGTRLAFVGIEFGLPLNNLLGLATGFPCYHQCFPFLLSLLLLGDSQLIVSAIFELFGKQVSLAGLFAV